MNRSGGSLTPSLSLSTAMAMASPRRSDGAGLTRWGAVALCAIRFDLEQGQVMEECYPAVAGAMSPEEELDVAFASFPDSMSQAPNRASVHDCMFFFRVRRRGSISPPSSSSSLNPLPRRSASVSLSSSVIFPEAADPSTRDGGVDPLLEPNWKARGGGVVENWHRRVSSESLISLGTETEDESPSHVPLVAPTSRPRPTNGARQVGRGGISSWGGPGSGGPRYLYGYVFNRQRKDERLKRGGEQKSVVILSERPYSSVFRPLLQILGPLYFDAGSAALEQVASYMAQWPNPVHGSLMELPLGSVMVRAHLPPAHTLPPGCGTPMDDFTSAMAPTPPFNPSVPQGVFHEADIFGIFRGILLQLWVLWELVLIGEPLLVIAPTPSQCCEAVAALIALVAPLPCSLDFRPYFTIHDPDFSHLNSLKEGEPVPPMILGVTNLFFLKALRYFPHIVSVGPTLANSDRRRPVVRSSSPNGVSNQGRLQRQLSPLKKFSPANLLKAARARRDGPLSLMTEHREALWTSHVATSKPDTAVLNRLVDAGMSPRVEESMSVVNNEILRRHFLELTTNFLAPFGPYLRATTPQEGASPFLDPPSLPPFDAHEFLEGLAARGPGKFLSKRLRSNWLDLYRRFLKGPNFMPWFQRRRAVAEHEQHRIWRLARAKADIKTFLSKMSEVEVIDSFNAVERHLLAEIQSLHRAGLKSMDSSVCQKLRADLRSIFNALPKDMQQLLLFNPQRAGLLQGGREPTKLPGRPSVHQIATESAISPSSSSESIKLAKLHDPASDKTTTPLTENT